MSEDFCATFPELRARRADLWRHLCSRSGVASQIASWLSRPATEELPTMLMREDASGQLQREVWRRLCDPKAPRGSGRGWKAYFTVARAKVRELERVRQACVDDNVGLAIAVARPHAGEHDYEDILQCAKEGLLIAVDWFDPERGTKFSTYATYWIRHAIQRGLRERYPIPMPNNPLRLLQKMGRVYYSLQASGEEVTIDAIAQNVGIAVDAAHAILATPQRRDSSCEELPSNDTPESWMLERELESALNEEVERLDPTQREVIKHKLGFNGHAILPICKLKDLYEVPVSGETIRLRYNRSLEKMRVNLQASGVIAI